MRTERDIEKDLSIKQYPEEKIEKSKEEIGRGLVKSDSFT